MDRFGGLIVLLGVWQKNSMMYPIYYWMGGKWNYTGVVFSDINEAHRYREYNCVRYVYIVVELPSSSSSKVPFRAPSIDHPPPTPEQVAAIR